MKTFQDYQQIVGRRDHTIECVSHLLDLDKQTEKTFRMINIEVYSVHDNLLNVSIVQRSPNFVLFKYKRIMSFIFLLSSVITLFMFSVKIYHLKIKEIGFLKSLLFANLVCHTIYNFIYSCGTSEHWTIQFLDNFINSLMMGLVLFLNLVLIDA